MILRHSKFLVRHSTFNFLARISFILIASACLLSFSGCYERNLAPPVEYAQEDVDRLNDEIEKIDWDD